MLTSQSLPSTRSRYSIWKAKVCFFTSQTLKSRKDPVNELTQVPNVPGCNQYFWSIKWQLAKILSKEFFFFLKEKSFYTTIPLQWWCKWMQNSKIWEQYFRFRSIFTAIFPQTRWKQDNAARFHCVPKQILAEHNCELIFGEAMTKEVNPSLVSPLSTCLGFFRFYIVLRRTCTPKIIISLTWRTSRAVAHSTVP